MIILVERSLCGTLHMSDGWYEHQNWRQRLRVAKKSMILSMVGWVVEKEVVWSNYNGRRECVAFVFSSNCICVFVFFKLYLCICMYIKISEATRKNIWWVVEKEVVV